MTTPDAAALFAEGTSRPRGGGRALIEQAADLGHEVAALWLAIDDIVQQHDTAAGLGWLARIPPDDTRPDGLVIRPQPFHPAFGEEFDEGWGEFSPAYLVVTTDPRAAARALSRAGVRLMGVTYAGVVLGPDHDVADDDEYTPNYVSSPRLDPDGASIHVDTKGETSQVMADTMVDIVVDELKRAGIVGVLAVPTDALSRPSGPGGALPWADGWKGPGHHDWAMTRMLVGGEPGVVHEYRTTDGTWSQDLDTADRRVITGDDPWDALSDADLAAGWAARDATPAGELPPTWQLVPRASS